MLFRYSSRKWKASYTRSPTNCIKDSFFFYNNTKTEQARPAEDKQEEEATIKML
jgi:hypothetical protein